MKLRKKVIHELMLSYKENKDAVIFARLLKRVDRLLTYLVKKIVKNRPYLYKIDSQELYHEAIIGLSKAAKSAKDAESDDHNIARIIAYVKSQICSSYSYHLQNERFLEETKTKNIKVTNETKEIQSFIIDVSEYIEKLNKDEREILFLRFFNDLTYNDIGKRLDIHRDTACKRIAKIIGKLRNMMGV